MRIPTLFIETIYLLKCEIKIFVFLYLLTKGMSYFKNPYNYQVEPKYGRLRPVQGAALGAAKIIAKKAAVYAVGGALRKGYQYVSGSGSAAGNSAPAQPLRGKKTTKRRQRKKACTKKKLVQKVCTMENQIKSLKMSENASLGQCTYRLLDSSRRLSNVNEQESSFFSPNSINNIETAIQNLKYFDPSAPGTLVTAAFGSGTYQRNVLLKSISQSLEIRNNYQSDCKLKVYLCTCKDDTSISPLNAWQSAYGDGGNATNENQLNQYPTDYDLVNDLWKLKVVINTALSPGQSVTCSHSVKNIEYDPATTDTHPDSYQKEYKAFGFLVVLHGTVSHDTAVSEQGIAQAGVDIIRKSTTVVSYDAGINIKYVQLDEDLDTFTNGAVQSHQPIPDNIGYSVA